jgi:hypothetical protein
VQDLVQVGDPRLERFDGGRTFALALALALPAPLLLSGRDVGVQIPSDGRRQLTAEHPEDDIDNRRDLGDRVIAHPLEGTEVKTL